LIEKPPTNKARRIGRDAARSKIKEQSEMSKPNRGKDGRRGGSPEV
jgi:hypothetical protein